VNERLSVRLLATFIGFAFSAFAQIDGARFAADLHAKYGPPLARETFAVRPGFEMVVDYAPNGHVCKIQLPPIGPSSEPGVETTQAVDDFLGELIPIKMRGKELGRMGEVFGLPSISIVEYENITIAQAFQGDARTGVTVTFANEKCPERPPHNVQ
jgi:hypothetical protein